MKMRMVWIMSLVVAAAVAGGAVPARAIGPAPVTRYSSFGLFSNYHLGGRTNVRLIEIEMTSPGRFRLEVHKNGKVISSWSFKNEHGGWHSLEFMQMDPAVRPNLSPYDIFLVNESPGTKWVKEVVINYY